jgi:hypothetical protein
MYAKAQADFNAVSGAARAGDAGSIQKLQQYASDYLEQSRNVLGPGAEYSANFQAVLSALEGVATGDVDAMTASVMRQETQTQTLVAELQALRTEVVNLRRETQQSAATPSRLVA